MKIVAATPPPSQPVSGLKLGIVRLGRAAGKVSEEQNIERWEVGGDSEQWCLVERKPTGHHRGKIQTGITEGTGMSAVAQ